MIEVKQIEPEEIDTFLEERHPEVNFLQYHDYGKIFEACGFKVFYLGLYENKNLVGSAVAVKRCAKRGKYIEVPGGPIVNWKNQKHVSAFIDALRDLAKLEKCVHVRIRPDIENTEENREIMTQNNLPESPICLHAEDTIMLDLTKSDDELMSDMRRQTRYEVRRSSKLGIEINYETSQAAFESFYDLQCETAKRQGFVQCSRDIVLAQHEVYGDKARIYTATLGTQVLAKALVILVKPEAIYHEAASTDAGRKYPGAYALQWRIINDAKAMDIQRYNLYGIAPPNSPNHRFAGVTTFKCGFGGQRVSYLHAHDIVINPVHYALIRALEMARKKKRHL